MIDKTVKSIVYLLSLWLSIGINAQNTTVVTGYVYGVDDQLPIVDAVVGFHNTAITTLPIRTVIFDWYRRIVIKLL